MDLNYLVAADTISGHNSLQSDDSEDDLESGDNESEAYKSFIASSPMKTSFHRNVRFAKYTSSGGSLSVGLGPAIGGRRSRILYSPWMVFTITILFLLMLYIPLFTFHDSSGMCKFTASIY